MLYERKSSIYEKKVVGGYHKQEMNWPQKIKFIIGMPSLVTLTPLPSNIIPKLCWHSQVQLPTPPTILCSHGIDLIIIKYETGKKLPQSLTINISTSVSIH